MKITAVAPVTNIPHFVVLVCAVGMRRRSGNVPIQRQRSRARVRYPISSRDATATTRRALRRRVDNPSGKSNESLSKTITRRQIVGSRRAKPHPNGPRWRNVVRRSEGVGCARGEGSSGGGLSGSAVSHAAHNTSFTLSRRCAPLATAGEEVGLPERRWKRLRRPVGRLSALRETMNVICHARTPRRTWRTGEFRGCCKSSRRLDVHCAG